MADDIGGAVMDESVQSSEPEATQPRKRALSIEHLRRMQEGRALARQKKAEREARKAEREALRAAQPEPRGIEMKTPDNGPRSVVKPFAFARPEPQEAPSGRVPRLVRMAEVGELLERFWMPILEWYPDANKGMVKPRLTLATRGVTDRLYRTDNGLALFEMRQTAFEPLPVVHTIFVVGRDIEALLDAGQTWAMEIGARRFVANRPIAGAEVAFWIRDLAERKARSLA